MKGCKSETENERNNLELRERERLREQTKKRGREIKRVC